MNTNVATFIALASILVLGPWQQYVLSTESFLAEFAARFYEVIMLFGRVIGPWEDLIPDQQERQISDILGLPDEVYVHLGKRVGCKYPASFSNQSSLQSKTYVSL
ncbi:MAG: hypothetical protein CMP98_12050 [Gammaproteobacteria bacterium]|nr:hypothetical protein [Gammaproteobacteria bacterium]OUU07763.1 MAG: hypothetical protein CBB94_12410 [Gammaproteobacteria bacterium TMED34]